MCWRRCIIFRYKNDGGFTLIETIMSFAVFAVAISGCAALLAFASRAYSTNYVRAELLSSARSAVDTLSANIARAKRIRLVSKPDGTLDYIELTELNTIGDDNNFTFIYARGTSSSDDYEAYRLNFGGLGNELSKYMKDVRIEYNESRTALRIRVETFDRLYEKSGVSVDPVVLYTAVDVRNKELFP